MVLNERVQRVKCHESRHESRLFANSATALVGLEEVLGAADGGTRVLPLGRALLGSLTEAADGGTSEEGADDLRDDLHSLE